MDTALEQILDRPSAERIKVALQLWESVTDKERYVHISAEHEAELDRRAQLL